MFRIQVRGLGNFSQQPAQDRLERREEILDGADHDRLDVGPFQGLQGRGIDDRVIQHEEGLGPAILKLKVQFVGFIQGVAGDANRSGFEGAEKGHREMRNVGQEEGHPVPPLDAFPDQEGGHPVGHILDLPVGLLVVGKDGVRAVGIFLGRFFKNLEERQGFVGQGMGNFRGPFKLVPKLFFHDGSPFCVGRLWKISIVVISDPASRAG